MVGATARLRKTELMDCIQVLVALGTEVGLRFGGYSRSTHALSRYAIGSL